MPGWLAGGGVVRDVDGTGSTGVTCSANDWASDAGVSTTGDTGCTCWVGRT